MNDHDDLQQRLQVAWNQFAALASRAEQDHLKQTLKAHHQELTDNDQHSELALAHAMLDDSLPRTIDGLLERHYPGAGHRFKKNAKAPEIEPKVLPSGAILGFGKYEVLDVGWAEAAIKWLENYHDRPDLPQPGTWLHIDDDDTVAIFGDWGGGCWDDNRVAETISREISRLSPDYCIHLGDVYYAGTPDQEKENLLAYWPQASKGNFTLNSNHEMYSADKGYYEVLENPIFAEQNGRSFFALERSDSILVGLDTAYHASKEDAYMHGKIHGTQGTFLDEVAGTGKEVTVLSHHNPLDITGEKKNKLWGEVSGHLGDRLKAWYWGHIHAAAVYQDTDGVRCRLTGHGVMPWGHASDLADSDKVNWFESTPAGGVRVQNGFVFLDPASGDCPEAFYGEDGKIHWPKPH